MPFFPVIKWSGSKRLLAGEIVSYFPKDCDLYFEPFLGGASVLLEYKPKKAFCVDINESLIDFWNIVKNKPEELAAHYKNNWEELQKDYRHFAKIRDHYNENKNGYDLLFLSRTCVNGLIRYNRDGDFNNSLHYSRKGADPEKVKKAILETSEIIQNYDFYSGDYQMILDRVTSKSLVYLDPPYFFTKSMYYGKIDYVRFWEFLFKLKEKGAKIALSFDGKTDNREYFVEVPKGLFKRHLYLKSGKSTFNKVIDKVNNEVYESLYLSW